MAYTTCTILSVTPDPTMTSIPGVIDVDTGRQLQIRANRNNIAVAVFTGSKSETPVKFHTFGDDLTDDRLAAWGAAVIASLNKQLDSAAAVTIGTPLELPDTRARDDAATKKAAATKAIARAQVVALDDADALTKYDAAVLAADVVAAAAVAAVADVLAKP